MVRSSNAVTAQHKDEILDAAAHTVKQLGFDGITIPGVMREVGLTPGGFYTHFESKTDLTTQAMSHAFDVQRSFLRQVSEQWAGDSRGAANAFASMYASSSDPERIGFGCPISALAGDVARSPLESAIRPVWIDELRQTLDVLSSLGRGDDDVTAEQRAETLVRFATLLGTSILSRAAAGDPLVDELRDAVLSELHIPDPLAVSGEDAG
jgi:TetR/AcrR family transcriptional repressor of nem operon